MYSEVKAIISRRAHVYDDMARKMMTREMDLKEEMKTSPNPDRIADELLNVVQMEETAIHIYSELRRLLNEINELEEDPVYE